MKTPTLLRIWKEARTLLPLWAVTLFAMIAPFFLSKYSSNPEGWSLAAYCLGAALLSTTSFGHEFTHRTMGLLLSQPVPRTRVWQEKMIVLGTMLFGTMFLFLVLWWWHGSRYEITDNLLSTALMIIGPAVIAFCLGPTFTMLVRGVLTGTALTVLWPFTLILVSLAIASLRYGSDEADKWVPGYFLILQSICCAFFLPLGLRTFQRFEDSGATSPEASLPAKLTSPFKSLPTILTLGRRGPIASLIRKELRLQQSTYLVTLVISITWLGLLVAKLLHPTIDAEALVLTPFMLGMIGIPTVAGIICVAEERNLGVHDWQLTLPVSARRQWLIKATITILTSMTLGVGLPYLLKLISIALFASPHDVPSKGEFAAFPWINLSLTALSIYASTFSTTAVRALLATVVLGITGFTLLNILIHIYNPHLTLELAIWIYFILLYVAFEMGLANFRRVVGSIWKPVRQVALFFAIFVLLYFAFNSIGRMALEAVMNFG